MQLFYFLGTIFLLLGTTALSMEKDHRAQNSVEQDLAELQAAFMLPSNQGSIIAHKILKAGPILPWLMNQPVSVFRHEGPVTAAYFDEDDLKLITATEGAIFKWDVQKKKNLGQLRSGSFPRRLSGNRLAVAENGSVFLLKSADGKKISTFEQGDAISTLALDPTGQWIASAGLDGIIKIWSIRHDSMVFHAQATTLIGEIKSISFAADGNSFLTAGTDGFLKLWNLTSRSCILELNTSGQVEQFLGAALHPAGTHAASVSLSGFKIWDLKAKTVLFENSTPACSVAFDKSGSQIAVGNQDGTIVIYALDRTAVHSLEGHAGPVLTVSFGNSGTQLLSASQDRTVKVWDLTRAHFLTHYELNPLQTLVLYSIYTSLKKDPVSKVRLVADLQRAYLSLPKGIQELLNEYVTPMTIPKKKSS